MFRPRYLGIDWGEKRLGLAHADELGIAFPIEPLLISNEAAALEALSVLIVRKKITHCVIGYPLHMDGSEGDKAQRVKAFAEKLFALTGVPYSLSDERLTTHEARQKTQRKYRKNSLQNAQKDRQSGRIDSQSAVIILQDHLNEQDVNHFLQDP
jgi:putative Holliday junction resolvase